MTTLIDAALVIITVGTALIAISPLGRLLGLYGPTRLVDSGFVLGMYGKPTWRFWGMFALFFGIHSASHFAEGKGILGSAWAVLTIMQLAHAAKAARERPDEKPPTEGEAEA